MKKKIVALVGAMVLTCAMSLNVLAAGSVTAADVAAAAGEVDVPATEAELAASAAVADSIIVFDESVSGLSTTALTVAEVLPIAEELASLNGQDDIESVSVVAVVDLVSAAAGKVVVKMSVGANETAVAIHVTDSGAVERIIGTVSGDTVIFEFSSFSPAAIVKVAHVQKAGDTTSSTSSDSTATAAATEDTSTAVAPKTGDMSVMVTVMAVIFMAGAAVAVFMAKKRA